MVVIFHWVGGDTIIEKVAFEQRPEGVGQVASERACGWRE